MDRLTIVSGLLFFLADVFAIVSLVMPDWIVSFVGGETRLGLLFTCETLYNREEICYSPSLGAAWLVSLSCVLLGTFCVSLTIILLLLSQCYVSHYIITYARWVGFAAMVMFCLAAVIFPVGFHAEEIGGEPYQLPNSFQVGYSYIFFVLALWMTVVSELFAGKVCLPHL